MMLSGHPFRVIDLPIDAGWNDISFDDMYQQSSNIINRTPVKEILSYLVLTSHGCHGRTISHPELGSTLHNQDVLACQLAIVESKQLEEYFGATAVLIQFAFLAPHGCIYEHSDHGFLEHAHRVHLPLRTSVGAVMTIGGTSMHLDRDVFCEIDNVKIHSVINNSDDYRVHLIIDLLPNN